MQNSKTLHCETYEEAAEWIDTHEMADDEENYEDRFLKWKAKRQADIDAIKEELEQYKKTQSKKIENKTAIIQEIEAGIDSLQEMSKEPKQD